jgi:hypothetical protein
MNESKWNPKIEKIILDIGEKSKEYKIMHRAESKRFEKGYQILMYLGIFLGPLAGLISGIGATFDPEADTTFPVISACVAFISGFVVATTKFGRFEEKSVEHRSAAGKYNSLAGNITRQMLLDRAYRVEAVKYMKWIGNSFDDLSASSPLISNKIYKEYKGSKGSNNIVFCEKLKSMEKGDIKNINKIISQKYSDGRMEYELDRMMGR